MTQRSTPMAERTQPTEETTPANPAPERPADDEGVAEVGPPGLTTADAQDTGASFADDDDATLVRALPRDSALAPASDDEDPSQQPSPTDSDRNAD